MVARRRPSMDRAMRSDWTTSWLPTLASYKVYAALPESRGIWILPPISGSVDECISPASSEAAESLRPGRLVEDGIKPRRHPLLHMRRGIRVTVERLAN